MDLEPDTGVEERPSRVTKKPFLRKGSRKEPSALNRSPSPAKSLPRDTSYNPPHSAHATVRLSDQLEETLGDDTQSVLAVRAQYQQRQMKEEQELSEFEQIELELRRGSNEHVAITLHNRNFDTTLLNNDEERPDSQHDITDWKTALSTMHSEMDRLGINDSPALQVDSSHYYGDWNTEHVDTTTHTKQMNSTDASDSKKPPRSVTTQQYQLPQQYAYDSEDDIVAHNTNSLYLSAQYDNDPEDDVGVYSDSSDSPLKPATNNNFNISRVNDSQSWGHVTRPVVRPAPIHGTTVNSAISQQQEEDRALKNKPKLASSVKTRVVRPLSASRAVRNVAAVKPKQQSKDSSPIVTGDLAAKARELEAELEHYKKETAALRQAKKQHETALAEIQKQKDELHDWIAAEKAAAEKWCSDLRNAAARERKAAALKHMREMSQRSALGSENSRKERAEIDGLHATIEKLKLDHDQSERKLKATILRLQNLTRDQSNQIADLQAQIVTLEAENSALQSGHMQPNSNKSNNKKKTYKTQSYAEEVSLHGVDITADITYVTADNKMPHSKSRNEVESESENGSYEYDDVEGGDDENHSEHAASANNEMPSYHAERYQTLTSSTNASSNASLASAPIQPKLSLSIPSAATPVISAPDTVSRSAEREETIRPDGTRVTKYRNGTLKLVRPNGDTEVQFVNGDVKYRSANDGATKYYYASAKTTHISYADGREEYEFPNKQRETHYKSGKKEIIFPDGTHKTVHVDGVQESLFPDGIRVIEYPNGEKKIIPPVR